MKCAVLLLSVIVAASVYGVVVQEEWKVFKVEYKTQYSSPDKVTNNKPEYVANQNNDQHNVNKIQHMNGNKCTAVPSMDSLQHFSTDAIPTEINWVEKGAVTPVQDQFKDYCTSGWAFSATGAIEGQYFVRKGRRINSLSAQELIDCSYFYGNEGCGYGTAAKAFAYVAGRGCMGSAQDYPYYATQGQCSYTSTCSNITVRGAYTKEDLGEQKLQLSVALLGPASVAIYSSLDSFKRYSGGVYYDKNCNFVTPEMLDHEVLVVGYGTEQPGGDYWLIKNSWGKTWGIHGYMKLAQNRANHCGVASRVSYPMLP